MANQSFTKDALLSGFPRRVLNLLAVRFGKFARTVKPIWRFFVKGPYSVIYMGERPIGRAKSTKYYVATLHELAALDAAARTQLTGEIHDAFIASLEQCCKQMGSRTRRLSTTAKCGCV